MLFGNQRAGWRSVGFGALLPPDPRREAGDERRVLSSVAFASQGQHELGLLSVLCPDFPRLPPPSQAPGGLPHVRPALPPR